MVFKTRRARVHPSSSSRSTSASKCGSKQSSMVRVDRKASVSSVASTSSASSVDIACEDFIVSIWEDLHKVRVNNLTDEQIEEAREAFAMFDPNNGGIIERKNLSTVFQTLGIKINKKQLQRLICNGAYVIDFMEFLEIIDGMSYDFDESIKEAFHIFDSDRSGAICSDKFRRVMMTSGAEMSDEEVKKIIEEVDVDGDGKINFEEFVNMLKGAI